MTSLAERRARFRALHQSGCFAIPNPWDGGTAVRLAKAGFPALASTSAGAAWALGKADGEMTLEEVLQHLRFLVSVTDLPSIRGVWRMQEEFFGSRPWSGKIEQG